MAANWNKIRNEYINGHISYDKLAKKHKVSIQAIKEKGAKEKWVAQKKEQQAKIRQKTDQKTIDKIAENESDLAAEINSAAFELLQKIKEATKQLDICLIKEKRKYTRQVVNPETGKVMYVDIEEETTRKDEKNKRINKAELKQLASALKDIQAIHLGGISDRPQEDRTVSIIFEAATPDDIEYDEEE